MKSLLTFLFVFIGTLTVSAQSIPNSGFENWTLTPGGISNPDYWNTSDSATFLNGGGHSAFSGTDSYEGSLCLHLLSWQISFLKGPGYASNGTINIVNFVPIYSGGSPDTIRHRYLSGYYKYNKLGASEVGSINIFLLRNNAGVRDTIATGTTFFTNNTSTYTQFITQMDYRDYINNPDTCLITILSSKAALSDPTIVVGTELIIDSLNFSGTVGIDEISNLVSKANIYPSPADNELNLEVELKKAAELQYEIYDFKGRLIIQSLMPAPKEKIDVSSLANGQYVLKLTDVKRNSLYSTNFTIGR